MKTQKEAYETYKKNLARQNAYNKAHYKQINISIPIADYETLQAIAGSRGLSVLGYMRQLVAESIAGVQAPPTDPTAVAGTDPDPNKNSTL